MNKQIHLEKILIEPVLYDFLIKLYLMPSYLQIKDLV